jgi:hypothetical protein
MDPALFPVAFSGLNIADVGLGHGRSGVGALSPSDGLREIRLRKLREQVPHAVKAVPNPLFVNCGFGLALSLGRSILDELDTFGDFTWREFIEQVLVESVSQKDKGTVKVLGRDIPGAALDELMPSHEVERHERQIRRYLDLHGGCQARAFDWLRSLDLIPTDERGNGFAHGLGLVQATRACPKKFAYLSDLEAVDWMREALRRRGLEAHIRVVGRFTRSPIR